MASIFALVAFIEMALLARWGGPLPGLILYPYLLLAATLGGCASLYLSWEGSHPLSQWTRTAALVIAGVVVGEASQLVEPSFPLSAVQLSHHFAVLFGFFHHGTLTIHRLPLPPITNALLALLWNLSPWILAGLIWDCVRSSKALEDWQARFYSGVRG